MIKIIKYLQYVSSFFKSNNKIGLLKELKKEVLLRGPITGIKSLLHIKIHVRDIIQARLDTVVPFRGRRHYSINENIQPQAKQAHGLNIISFSIIFFANEITNDFISCIRSFAGCLNDIDYEMLVIATDSEAISKIDQQMNGLQLFFCSENIEINKCISNVKGKNIVIVHKEVTVQKDWIKEMLYIIDNNRFAGVIGSKIINNEGLLVESGGIIWHNGLLTHYGNADNPDLPEYNYVKEVDFVQNGPIVIRKKVWDIIGGFDNTLLSKDIGILDLCLSVRLHGYKVIYTPFSEVMMINNSMKDISKDVIEREKKYLYEKWQIELLRKSFINNHIFIERDRSVGKKHVLFVETDHGKWQNKEGIEVISNFIDALVAMNYSVKLLGKRENEDILSRGQYQRNEVEVLYGNSDFFSKQGWRHYIYSNIVYLNAIILGEGSLCSEALKFLIDIHYNGKIIYYDLNKGYLKVYDGVIEFRKQSKMIDLNRREVGYIYNMFINGDETMSVKSMFSYNNIRQAFHEIIG